MKDSVLSSKFSFFVWMVAYSCNPGHNGVYRKSIIDEPGPCAVQAGEHLLLLCGGILKESIKFKQDSSWFIPIIYILLGFLRLSK